MFPDVVSVPALRALNRPTVMREVMFGLDVGRLKRHRRGADDGSIGVAKCLEMFSDPKAGPQSRSRMKPFLAG